MQNFLVSVCLASALFSTLNAAPTTIAAKNELTICGEQLAKKIVALNGNFFTEEQIMDLMQKDFDMYYKEGKTLPEIAEYYEANYRNIGLEPEQVDIITSLYSNLTQILGGKENLTEIYAKMQNASLEFIKADKAEVDQNIAQLKANGTSDVEVEVSVCQQTFQLVTAQKRIQLEKILFGILPADKVDIVKSQIKQFTKILSDQ